MDASSLEFFQKQVGELEQELRAAQDKLIGDLERRTQRDATGWAAEIAVQEASIEHLTKELAEARSTCAFIIQRERDKIRLLSSTEDALVSALCLLVLEGERELPQFLGDFHAWNENRGVTGVLHVFSTWCAVYIEGQKLVLSQCVTWLQERCKLLRVLHKNGHPCGTPEAEMPMRARKVPNCTLAVEWHTPEMARQHKTKRERRAVGDDATVTAPELGGGAAAAADDDADPSSSGPCSRGAEQREIIASMTDTLGRAACECIAYAHRPTYLLSQLQALQHDQLNPSRLISTEALLWTPAQGRFIFAAASHTPLDHHGASVANGTLRQRLQRAPGSFVCSGWGAGPLGCLAVVINHPARNVLDEASALADALADALKTVGASGGPFSVAVAWNDTAAAEAEGNANPEFMVCNTAEQTVIGWGVRKLRCMLQFAVENGEKSVLANSFVSRLTVLERSKIRLVARVRFHRTMEADDIWAPPLGGTSSTGKEVDEQLRHVNKVTRGMVARRHGLQERRGLVDPGFEMLAAEREKMRAENQERNDIEQAFYRLQSLDQHTTVLVTDAVEYWMSGDPQGLDDVFYAKLRRLLNVLEISHTDPQARVDFDRFFVVTMRLRHG